MRVLICRGPESSFRPQRYIVDEIKRALEEIKPSNVEVLELDVQANFTTLSNQKLFYDDESMFKNSAATLNAVKDIQKGDVIFFSEGWSAVIPAIRFYVYTCLGSLDAVRMIGMFHSTAETPGDFFYGSGDWGRQLEASMVASLDAVLVATGYGVNGLRQNRFIPNSHLEKKVVSGTFPFTPQAFSLDDILPKEPYSICFSHRWSEEKDPMFFVEVVKQLKKTAPKTKGYVLTPFPMKPAGMVQSVDQAQAEGIEFIYCEDRNTYFRNLSRMHCVFSAATLETFGYSILEGVQMGAIPFVSHEACYPYLYNPAFMYHKVNGAEAAAQKLGEHFDHTVDERGNVDCPSIEKVFLPGVYDKIRLAPYEAARVILNHPSTVK